MFVVGFIMNRRNYHGGVPPVQNCSVMFIYQEVFESSVIMRTVNGIKRTSGISTVNFGTMSAIHYLERKNI